MANCWHREGSPDDTFGLFFPKLQLSPEQSQQLTPRITILEVTGA
jgi:hypothetical protein